MAANFNLSARNLYLITGPKIAEIGKIANISRR